MYLQQSTGKLNHTCLLLPFLEAYESPRLKKKAETGQWAPSRFPRSASFFSSFSSSSFFHLEIFSLHSRLELYFIIAKYPQTRQFASRISKFVIPATSCLGYRHQLSRKCRSSNTKTAIQAPRHNVTQPSFQRCHCTVRTTHLTVRPFQPRCWRSAQREVLRLAEAEIRPAAVIKGK